MVTVNTGAGGTDSSVITVAFNGVSASVGDSVYVSAPGTVAEANATSASTMPVVGFISQVITPTQVKVQTAGVVGGFAGLTTGQRVFQATTNGQVSHTPPSASGNVAQEVGLATDTNQILIILDADAVEIG